MDQLKDLLSEVTSSRYDLATKTLDLTSLFEDDRLHVTLGGCYLPRYLGWSKRLGTVGTLGEVFKEKKLEVSQPFQGLTCLPWSG